MRSLNRSIVIAALALLPLGCAVGPDFKKPEAQVPAGWSAASASNAVNSDPATVVNWWTTFQEPTLSSLIERSTQSNLDLRSEEHTSELQSHVNLVCRLLLEKKKKK